MCVRVRVLRGWRETDIHTGLDEMRGGAERDGRTVTSWTRAERCRRLCSAEDRNEHVRPRDWGGGGPAAGDIVGLSLRMA